MNVEGALSLLFQRVDASYTLYGFYITVIIGLLSFLATYGFDKLHKRSKIILTIAIAAFIYSNQAGLLRNLTQRGEIVELITNFGHNSTEIINIANSSLPLSNVLTISFNVCLGLLVIVLIWVIPRPDDEHFESN